MSAANEARRLASLRGLSLAGIKAAKADGFLTFGEHQKASAWFIRDERACCVRRIDGKLWNLRGENPKALDLPGTSGLRVSGWPVGISRAAEYESIFVCEGGPDALAAYSIREALKRVFGIVCVFGSGLTIDEGALSHFSGKRVRFIAHTDEAGKTFAERNAKLLEPIAAQVSIADLRGLNDMKGTSASDLCDVVAFRKLEAIPNEIAEIFDFTGSPSRVRIIAAQTMLFDEKAGASDVVTQEHPRNTQGGHRNTQKMGRGERAQDRIEFLHEKARSLACFGRGQTRTNLFTLARYVRNDDRATQDAVFESWHSASRAHLDPKESRVEYLVRFQSVIKKARVPMGNADGLAIAEERASRSPLKEIPGVPDAPIGWLVLASVCRELQRLAGNAPFFIGMRDAARISGKQNATEGGRALEGLALFGVIQCVKRGEARPGGKASEYRYLAGNTP